MRAGVLRARKLKAHKPDLDDGTVREPSKASGAARRSGDGSRDPAANGRRGLEERAAYGARTRCKSGVQITRQEREYSRACKARCAPGAPVACAGLRSCEAVCVPYGLAGREQDSGIEPGGICTAPQQQQDTGDGPWQRTCPALSALCSSPSPPLVHAGRASPACLHAAVERDRAWYRSPRQRAWMTRSAAAGCIIL